MKSFIKLLSVFLMLSLLLCGCGTTSADILDIGGIGFKKGLEDFNDNFENEVPKSVLDTLDFMLDNYTNGLSVPDIDDILKVEINDDDDKDKLNKDADDKINSKEDAKKIIVEALSKTEPDVTFRIDKTLFSDEFFYDLIFYEIGGYYIVEALGLNSYAYSYYEDIIAGEVVVDISFNYFELSHYNHKFSLDQIKKMKIELKQEAEKVVKALNLNSLSVYERISAVNKYLCDTIEYSKGNQNFKPIQHTPYGALINGDCVCEGYTKAAQLLFQLCGIKSYYVSGTANGDGHCWNLVELDGKYYQLDITWNDAEIMNNQYFLVTDKYMQLTRVWDKAKYPKSATEPYKLSS